MNTTLSPIIMVQWKMGAWKMTLVSKGAIFHFHDYGRKGNITNQYDYKSIITLYICDMCI